MKKFFKDHVWVALLALTMFCGTVQAADEDLTGAWYDPAQPGFGFIFDDEPGVSTFVAWFTYGFGKEPSQAWYVGFEQYPHDNVFDINKPLATFPAVGWFQPAPVGYVIVEVLGDEMLVVWHFYQEAPCLTPRVSPSPPFCDGEAVLVRLIAP